MKIRWTLGILILSVLVVINILKRDAEGNWTQKADMLTPRTRFSTSVVDGKIYAIGGENEADDKFGEISIAVVEMYDPKTDTSQPKADMPTPRAGLATSVVDGKIYAIGGEAFGLLRGKAPWRLKTVEVYNPATDTWQKSQSLIHARDGLTTAVVDGEIYAMGGTGWPQIPAHPGPFLASVEVFNPKTHRWREKAEMPAPKSNHTASVINGKIYVIGGGFRGNGPFMYLSTIEIYDPQTDKWTQGGICRSANRDMRLRS
jgi:N-acetylneuraminic acid mutarotase